MIRDLISRIPGARKAYHLIGHGVGTSVPEALVRDYLRQHGPKKLHLGCGQNAIPGWLNTDYYPRRQDILHLDATKPFPLPAESFDYVFSEHMIEHITYHDGLTMLKESRRVLKPGGRIRISTPDLKFLIELKKKHGLPAN